MAQPDLSLASILTRRLAWIALAVMVVNALAVATYYGSDRQLLEREAVERELDKLKAAVTGDSLRVAQPARRLFIDYPDAYGFALLHPDGRLLDGENNRLIPEQALSSGLFIQDWQTRLAQSEGTSLVVSRLAEIQGDTLQLVFVMQDDPARLVRKALIIEFIKHIWLPILPIALILIGANAFMIRRSIRPVSVAARWARSIKPGTAAAPLASHDLPAEITDLVEATQRSLERLSMALSAEQRRAAEAAHALRTPLAILMARLDALPAGPTTDKVRADLAVLSRTVRQILDSARADGLQVTEDTRTDLCAVASNVVAALAPAAYQQGAEVSLVVQATSIFARAAPDAVELAVSNLVENAIVHSRSPLIEVTVGPGPIISVSDSGCGLPADAGNRLFEPFWRGEGASPGGAGLGLAIVDRLQRAQGGSVSADNRSEDGARFVLTFQAD
ncbi:MAG: sensor histidine kinase [Pseudomonadaceae bacterium]